MERFENGDLGIEIKLYPLHCFFKLLYLLVFKHKTIKQRNCKINCSISNFKKINQKNNVTVMLRNTILQLYAVFAICH